MHCQFTFGDIGLRQDFRSPWYHGTIDTKIARHHVESCLFSVALNRELLSSVLIPVLLLEQSPLTVYSRYDAKPCSELILLSNLLEFHQLNGKY
jgi:hypothetical protein